MLSAKYRHTKGLILDWSYRTTFRNILLSWKGGLCGIYQSATAVVFHGEQIENKFYNLDNTGHSDLIIIVCLALEKIQKT